MATVKVLHDGTAEGLRSGSADFRRGFDRRRETMREITLDKPRRIEFTRNSLMLAGNLMHCPPEDIIVYVLTPPPDVEKVVVFIWAGCLEEDPKLEVGDVKNWVMKAAKPGSFLKAPSVIKAIFLCGAALKEYLREGQ